jgi:hypothetical protein
MYQALVRITKDDRIAADEPLVGAPSESPRFDWAALLNALLRLMREATGAASPRQ